MFNAQKPDPSELPSTGRLLKSTRIAAAVAGVLLVFVVLPAEYGVDPTGAGSLLGLTEMGRIKMQLAEEAALNEAEITGPSSAGATPSPEPAPSAQASPTPLAPSAAATATPSTPSASPPQSASAAASDESVFTLAPDEGFEIKLVMVKGAKAKYEWFTDGPGVNYDTHADGAGVSYHGYSKGTNTPRQEGELVAAFDGSHGWFWRNRTDQDVKITLRTSGEYTEVKQYD